MDRLWLEKNGITWTGIDYSGKHRLDNTAFPHFAFSPLPEGLINSFLTEVGQPCPEDLHFKGGKWFEREISAVVNCQSQNRGWETAGDWGGEVLRTWEAALRFEPALRALCSWLSPSSSRPPSLCPFLSGSFAFLLSFQDSELLGNSRQELRFSLWWAASGQGQGVWWSSHYRCLCREEDNSSNLPSLHPRFPGTEKMRGLDEGTKLCLGHLPSHLPILLLSSPISKTSFPVGPRMLLVLLASYCPTQIHSDLDHPDLLQLACCCPQLFPHQGHHTYVGRPCGLTLLFNRMEVFLVFF